VIVMRVATRGFTLIEVLVTVVIVAVMASVLVLSIGAGDEEQVLRREAERLQARIGYACERAELSGREVGLHLRDGGYAFSAQQTEGWRFIEDDVALKRVNLPDATHLSADDQTLEAMFPEQPQFLCFASGEAMPMVIELAAGPRATRWRIDIALDGQTTLRHRGIDDRDWLDAGGPR
jgi:general secretion pathway protein H